MIRKKPNRSPTKWVRFGEEEQGSADESCGGKKGKSSLSGADFDSEKTKPKPNEVGSVWRGGARERRRKLRQKEETERLERSGL